MKTARFGNGINYKKWDGYQKKPKASSKTIKTQNPMRQCQTDLGPDEALWFAEEVGEREKEEEGEIAEGEDQVPDALNKTQTKPCQLV